MPEYISQDGFTASLSDDGTMDTVISVSCDTCSAVREIRFTITDYERDVPSLLEEAIDAFAEEHLEHNLDELVSL